MTGTFGTVAFVFVVEDISRFPIFFWSPVSVGFWKRKARMPFLLSGTAFLLQGNNNKHNVS